MCGFPLDSLNLVRFPYREPNLGYSWEIQHIAELIRKGKVIVDCFGGSKHFEHSLFEVKSTQILHRRRALLRYCDTRFGLYFIMLHRLLLLKSVLVSCVTCPEWIERHPEGVRDEVKEIIMDAAFWKEVNVLIIVTWPLIQLIRVGDSDKPTLHTVYKAAFQVKIRIDDIRNRFDVEYIGQAIEAYEKYEDDLMPEAAQVAISCCVSLFIFTHSF